MRHKWWWLAMGGSSVLWGYHWLSQRAIPPQKRRRVANVATSQTPTIFIPGWGGNAWTYNGMLRWFSRQGYATKVLTVKVDWTGTPHFSGAWPQTAENPTIQILFEHNFTLDYQQQIGWITRILRELKQRYGVTHYNAVAHSWGGSAIVQSLVRYGDQADLPRLKRLVLLGAPVEEGPVKGGVDPAYRQLLAARQHLWANAGAEIHNVYGLLAGRLTDGEVPVHQVTALRRVVAGTPVQYVEHPVVNIGHGRLHSALRMWRLVAQLLWGPAQAAGRTGH